MYEPINTLSREQVKQLHQLYQHEWWTQGRTLADVQTMVEHSDYLFGLCERQSSQLVAFARVLSDRVYRAIIFDVIVAVDHRHQGLGTELIHQITTHPDLSQIECILLFCLPNMMPFYQKLGFSEAKQVILVHSQMVPVLTAEPAEQPMN